MKLFYSFWKKRRTGGFTLIETVVSLAVFVIISIAVYQAYGALLRSISSSRARLVGAALAREEFEIIRNLPYVNVGIVGGLPNGTVPHIETVTRNNIPFTVETTIRSVDDPFDGTLGGIPNDTTPSDYKLVQIDIDCAVCQGYATQSFVSYVAPRALETPTSSGALFVQVIDANGQPVPDADVHIVNTKITPSITIDDTTNKNGLLQIVDAPPGVNAYQITVSKSGYSTERTYTPGAAGNPNPSKPDATVVAQQITQLSFAIDRTGAIAASTVSATCAPVGGVAFFLNGAKNIGTNPTVRKYSQSLTTDGGGLKSISGLEWDSYDALIATSSAYDMAGTIPLAPISLAPGATQNLQFVVRAKNSRAFLLTVKDAATGLALSGANATLENGAFSDAQTTGRGFLSQTDWSGGSGQALMGDATRYLSSDGNIEISAPAGDLRLKHLFGGSDYVSSGNLTSSTFDTGSASNFYQISWLPQDQATSTGSGSVRFQIATNNDNATWNYVGPDGTSATYYTQTNTNIAAVHNGDRYLRYKVYLATNTISTTPIISDVAVTFNSLCVPPGQVLWGGLSSGAYTLTVSKAGYQNYTGTVSMSSSWQQQQITLLPQ